MSHRNLPGPRIPVRLLLVFALALPGCGSGGKDGGTPHPAQTPFRHRVIEHVQPHPLTGIASGDFFTPSLSYPPIPVAARYRHVLNFMVTPFLPPLLEPTPTNGPLVLYSDEMEVIVFSPMDRFFETLVTFEAGEIHSGLEGDLEEVPAGFSHRFLLVEGRGMARTLEHWGDLLLADRGRTRIDRYADEGEAYLGYWTDNGAHYYYRTEPGMTTEETLLAVRADGEARGIPYRYLQLDSWWYVKEPGAIPLPFITGGLVSWKPLPELFPDGLAAFRDRLGLPLITHNKWFAPETPYRERYPFVDGDDMSLPTGRGVYDEFMADAVSWGVTTYEQDWLVTQYMGVPWLRSGVGHARSWMDHLHDAARDAGLTMQLCMASGAHLMDAVDRPAVTSIRTSLDYFLGISKESFWPMFHTVNLLAWAVGIPPFKDNFQTAEPYGEAETLIASLSAGMVGPSDALGAADAELLNRTCRSDGLLLKPDRPALPIDAMFLPHERPFTVSTFSRRTGLGTWTYLAAFHLSRNHPERRTLDAFFAGVSYDFRDLGTMFVWPDEVTDWSLSLEGDLAIADPMVAYDWRTGTAWPAEDRLDLPEHPHLYDFAYLVLAPILSNGLALIGEPDKFVTVADKRFLRVSTTENGLEIALAGAPAERVRLLAYDARTERLLPEVEVVIGADGLGGAAIIRP